uniref:Uncharacterized protein n=1 Tax=viral metagenome TaxID=1070528 RepID=A0A6H1ZFU5_9ZZZZ
MLKSINIAPEEVARIQESEWEFQSIDRCLVSSSGFEKEDWRQKWIEAKRSLNIQVETLFHIYCKVDTIITFGPSIQFFQNTIIWGEQDK